jgi:hypothetical protein
VTTPHRRRPRVVELVVEVALASDAVDGADQAVVGPIVYPVGVMNSEPAQIENELT